MPLQPLLVATPSGRGLAIPFNFFPATFPPPQPGVLPMRAARPELQFAIAQEAPVAPASAAENAYVRAVTTESSLVMASADTPLQLAAVLPVLRDSPLRTALSL